MLGGPESRSARRGRRHPATCKLTIIRRESPLVVVAFNRARSTGGLKGWVATGGPGPPSKPVGRPASTGSGRFLSCGRGSALCWRYRRWCAALCRAMSRLSTTKANYLTPGTSVALIVSRTSSVTGRLDHVDLHRFRARGPDDSNNRRLGISLRDSRVLKLGHRKEYEVLPGVTGLERPVTGSHVRLRKTQAQV